MSWNNNMALNYTLKENKSLEAMVTFLLTLPTILKITNGLNGYHRNW